MSEAWFWLTYFAVGATSFALTFIVAKGQRWIGVISVTIIGTIVILSVADLHSTIRIYDDPWFGAALFINGAFCALFALAGLFAGSFRDC